MPKDKVDAVVMWATRPEVDYVIPHSGEVDEALASVVCDHQISNEHYLMPIQWPTVHQIGPR